MPWRETHVSEQRVLLIAEHLRGERSVQDIAKHFGVSRKTAYKWIERFKSGGLLQELSRRPLSSPSRTATSTVELLVETRRAHPTWGPRKLLGYLERRPEYVDVTWPAASTVGDILKRQGLVEARRHRRRLAGERRACVNADAPNDSWSVDLKGHFRLGNGRRCDPLTITDNHSRYLLCCVAVDEPKLTFIQPLIEAAFLKYGLPTSMLLPSRPRSCLHNDNVDHWFATVDGRDLDATIALAREIIAAGVWRPGMLRRFVRLHRHEVTRLLRRLGPLVPSHMR